VAGAPAAAADATNPTGATGPAGAAVAAAPSDPAAGRVAPGVPAIAPAGPAPTLNAPAAPAPSAPMPSALPERAAVAAQLTAPIASLRAAGDGEHVMVVRVSPDSIGPVRVRAHIGAEGVRIELLGATDAAREALKVALPDLRRDLIVAGLPADLSLSTGRQSTGTETGWGGGAAGDPRGQGDRATTGAPGGRAVPGGAAEAPAPTAPALGGGLRGLDITV
jgi:flagellar hook-length control protein FliK